jgi:Cu+-exporting ATPase
MATSAPSPTTLTLRITGMTCGGCAGAVAAALRAVPGAAAVRVDLPTGQAQVEADPALRPVLAAAVERAGFRVAAG